MNINCQGPPLAPLHRAWALGEALRRAADSVPERIALVGTGGISHWPATPDSGKINEAWDRELLERWQANDKQALLSYTDEATYRDAGQGGFEIRTFIAVAAAARGRGTLQYYRPIPMFAVGCTIADMSVAAKARPMSHMTLEYSANLRAGGRFGDLCRKLAQFMTGLNVEGQPVFPPGGVRVRAIPCEDYCIADGSVQDAGFVHAILKIGAGRSDAAKHATVHRSVRHHEGAFRGAICGAGLALSLEFIEFSESGTLKHNNLHARLKKLRSRPVGAQVAAEARFNAAA